jgi:serine/threonine protein kinase, bacterial
MKTKIILTALALLSSLTFRAQAQVTVSTVATTDLAEPYGVLFDAENNLFISDGANNRIVRIDAATQGASTLAGIPTDPPGSNDGFAYLAHFNNPQGILLVNYNGVAGLLVADYGNHLIRFVRLSDGFVTTLAGQVNGGPPADATGTSATFRYPISFDQDTSGNIYIADFGNNAIRVMNLNDPNLGVTNIVISGTTLFRPSAVAFVSPNQLWVADTGNQMVKLFTLTTPTTATLTSSLGGYRTVGTADSSFGPDARFNGPSGLLWLQGIGLLISDTLNNTIRIATNYTPFGANNYRVITFVGTPGQAGLVDGNALSAKLNSPVGLAIDSANNGFVLADLKNNAIRRIQTGPVQPPVPAPLIGWVDFTVPPSIIVSVLRPGPSFVFNNDVVIAILDTDGTETHYTFGETPSNPLNDTIPNPSATVGSTPPNYHDGMFPDEVPPSIVLPQPDVTIKAIGFQSGRKSSSIVSSRFQFRVAGPGIQGDNAASFKVINETVGAQMWYTVDGSDPTNRPPSIGPISSGTILSTNITTNFTFKIRGFRNNYQPSEVVAQNFSATNFNANKITFGFESGEASSDFNAAPGQFFYAPVTLTVLPSVSMYSLQFNVTVTNTPQTTSQVEPGAVAFTSMLMMQVPPGFGDHLPPGSIQWYDTIPPWKFIGTNGLGSNVFANLMFTNAALNLLGVGWLERFGLPFLYPTTLHDLINFSIAHDTLFTKDTGQVVVGAYTFKVPSNAAVGDQYQIQIDRPSATSDGVGAPGSDVFIATPRSGSLSNGAINSIKWVTVNPRSYIAGDVYPFRWFNAGDFGKGCLNAADVMQVFQTAIYGMDPPPPLSDYNAALDTCCATAGSTVTSNGVVTHYQNGGSTVNALDIFDGNDLSINDYPFGDGVLDCTDVYVTYRRSLDPSLTWWRRIWTTSGLAAQTTPNVACQTNNPDGGGGQGGGNGTGPVGKLSSVTFVAGDAIGGAGQTVQIPISAKITGDQPIRVLALNLTVQPLDGAPAIGQPIQFSPASGLGEPTLTASKTPANFVATWLDSTVAGISGDPAVLGMLQITLPASLPPGAAYAIHFDHVSASPNGLASFPKKTETGLITVTDRSSSSYNDGIPDSWRLRYFGSANNLLSQANADADGDGANNMSEFVAGTDPTDNTSSLKLSTSRSTQASSCVIRWPSIAGKQYIIERSVSMFSGSWQPIATNTGTGTEIEFHDSSSGGSARFYRVRVQ